jgi:Ser/Thr protein kinase RdoA (MazF antagonist)
MSAGAPIPPTEIAARFRLGGELDSMEHLGRGHIHDTWVSRVRTAAGPRRFVHQRLNRDVFPDPAKVMENVARITAHVRHRVAREGGDPERGSLTLVPTADGAPFHESPDGQCWRTYRYIEGTTHHDGVAPPRIVAEAARAFARFQRRVADMPGPRLQETIPHFGDTRRRLRALVEAVEADAAGRVAGARSEIDAVLEREPLSRLLPDALEGGEVPERIVHFDTKLNNVLLDAATGEGVCVIDLDTVMHGTALYDFGDCVRSATSRGAEDERDPHAAAFDLERFEALARGWLEEAAGFLTPREVELLPAAARAVTYTCGVRFLTDHLAGDRYFKVDREGHNLDRCRTQLEMLRGMEEAAARMDEIVARLS